MSKDLFIDGSINGIRARIMKIKYFLGLPPYPQKLPPCSDIVTTFALFLSLPLAGTRADLQTGLPPALLGPDNSFPSCPIRFMMRN